ncbi:CREB/ATF bZIP transcription factor [Sceloporus undulatus]|uniref:CREB/ATF bZIP transcription factor n=1 Tax=Sceloporus undulatus TaxID=8520 RepID=UPI001C4DC12B|nr:CREB/ATF bZIP transcription factor [Sceloporus undulatus]
MRHSLAQLLASPPGNGSPESAGSPEEAEPRHEAAFFHFGGAEEEGLLSASELELDWLEALAGGGGPALPAPEASPRRPSSHRLKAAAAARLNRQKKKQYVSGLEARLQSLASENRRLKERNRGLCRRLRGLERETGYLRAVLANQSAVGRLLGRLAGGAGLRVRSSLLEDGERRLPWGSSDHDYALPVPVEEEMEDGEDEEEEEEEMEDTRGPAAPSLSSSSGICLHVDQDQVSVEFCAICARRAASFSFAEASDAAAAAAASSSKIFSFRCLPCQAPLCRG